MAWLLVPAESGPLLVGLCAFIGAVLYQSRKRGKTVVVMELPDALAALDLTPEERTRLRLDIFTTDYGRLGHWYVEIDGKPWAVLREPSSEDMFWVSYRVDLLCDTAEERLKRASEHFWLEQKMVFRSVRFGLIAEHAFPAVTEPYRDGRLHMRGLYITMPGPTRAEQARLKSKNFKEPA